MASKLLVFVNASPTIGIRRVLEATSSVDCPLVWVDLASDHDADETALGSRLVEAVNRAAAANVLPSGMTLYKAISAFRRLAKLLGPFVIAISGAERFAEAVCELISFHEGGTRVVVIGCESLPTTTIAHWLVISHEELRVTHDEVVIFAGGRLDGIEIAALMEACDGDYVRLNDAVRVRSGLPPIWSYSSDETIATSAKEFGLDAATLAEALARRKRYVEAFELMCSQAQHIVPRFIDVCGDAFFGRGLFDRFWFHMNRLEMKVIEHEKVIRWYFAAAMAVNRHDDVVPLVEAYLSKNEAPELRSHYAASRPSRQFLDETTRAVRALESPVTLRHHAFALSLSGRHQEACETLQRGLRLADVLGSDQMVVAMGTDMCIALQRAGAFRDSLWWGEWACREYSRRGLREDYRRLSGVAALAFSKMLVGDDIGLKELVDDIDFSAGLIGVPSYEGVVSTLADFLSVSGEQDRAVDLYELTFDAAPFDLAGLIAVDYVRCLADVGRFDRALDVGERAFAVSRGASLYQQHCGSLARGIALKAAKDPRAVASLRASVEAFSDGLDGVRLCQACIHLAEACLVSEDVDGARWAISQASGRLLELGETGWMLLGGTGRGVSRVRALAAATPAGLSLTVLGSPSATLYAEKVSLTYRQLEILAILAHRPEGVSLETLSGLIYGERAVLGTTKATVSRLRSTVPLTSRPYRIGVPFRADFLELMDHLKHGRLRQALSLYRGPLLEQSEAPAIADIREQIGESLRQAVLGSGDAVAMLELANRTDEGDLQLLEEAYRNLPPQDPQSPLVRARIRQIRKDWGVDSQT